jgi:O-antigen/teichoic acid export membrane protein
VLAPARSGRERVEYDAAVIWQQTGFCMLAGIIVVIAGYAAAWLSPRWNFTPLVHALAAVTVLFVAQDFVRRFLFVRGRAVLAFASDAMTQGLKLCILAALGVSVALTAAHALWIVAAALLAGILLGAALSSGQARVGINRRAIIAVSADHWRIGKWLLASNVIYWGGSQLVLYTSGALLSAAAVGNITAALNIVGVANVLFLALENIVPTRAAELVSAGGRGVMNNYLRKVTMLGTLATLTIGLIASVWSETWLGLFYGSAYRGMGWLLPWAAAFYVLGFFQRPLSAGLRALGNTRAVFQSGALAALVALIISYPCVRMGGIAGAMLALCVVQAAVVLVLYVSYRKLLARITDGASPLARHARLAPKASSESSS